MNQAQPDPSLDAAWVSVDTPLELAALREFCDDIERLLRINPYLEFRNWQDCGNGAFRAVFLNLSNQQQVALEFRVERESANAFALVYGAGLKARTRVVLEPTASGSRLTITDDYERLPPEQRARRLDEVDKSLRAWGQALHEYLRREHRWGTSPFWRWYMRRVWLPMTPRARRVVYMLWLVTVAELILIVFVAAIYWIETS